MGYLKQALDWIVPVLKEKKIPFHITGGFAAHLYGATRSVNDIDIDLPTEHLENLLPELQPFIEYPAQRHTDSTWNLYGCTLNYHGQLIDLTGDREAYINNKNTGQWEPLEINFAKVVWVNALGHDLPIQNPEHLVEYKLKIKYDEEKHLADVAAVRKYMSESA